MKEFISIRTSRDKTEAYLYIKEPPRVGFDIAAPTEEDIRELLDLHGIVYGIFDEAIKSATVSPVYDVEIVIARGALPQKGKDGYLEHLFEQSPEKKPALREDGTVDYKDMNVVHSIRKDEKLCNIIPPEQGVDGIDVYGNVLPASSGRPTVLPRGKGVRITEDGLSAVSSIDGQVRRSGPNYEVKPVFDVSGDVDYSIGNIRFAGNVIVRGSVLSGFTIEAGGTVEVFGSVEKANISAAGDIILHGGMGGGGSGTLKSGGSIYVKYIENCILSAYGDISAEWIMHCTVLSGGSVTVKGKKGLLVGGSVKAANMVKAMTIGSKYGTQTDIEVGIDPRVRSRLKEIKDELPILENEEKKTTQAINLFKKMEWSGRLPEERKAQYKKALETNNYQKGAIDKIKDEQRELEGLLQRETKGVVKASNLIYNGVKVAIGSATMVVTDTLSRCSLKRDGADVRVSAY
ncbi:MAG: FapA family protein [Oscillospiraceae bacterium]|nr:FapA family protein [Oscillospiraceae bacterium]